MRRNGINRLSANVICVCFPGFAVAVAGATPSPLPVVTLAHVLVCEEERGEERGERGEKGRRMGGEGSAERGDGMKQNGREGRHQDLYIPVCNSEYCICTVHQFAQSHGTK